jgi:hypothetical protein
MAEKDKKAAWGEAVPPVSENTVPGVSNEVEPLKAKSKEEVDIESFKSSIDFSKYPSHWVFVDQEYADGIPRVAMWRDSKGPTPHTAPVHPNEVASWSQSGWNVGNQPPEE